MLVAGPVAVSVVAAELSVVETFAVAEVSAVPLFAWN